ncbi:MAG TPA: hypothetical protein VGK32_01550 [Vicinamibacterales bacterium]|jgi:hypothetical protein
MCLCRSSRYLIAIVAALVIAGGASAQQQNAAAKPEGLQFRFLGPAVGNRIAAVAGVPGDPSTYYVGAASGGVWKTVDGGLKWTPVFDAQPVAAIGALAVAPSDPTTVWAGTGEAWAIRDIDVMGDGVYKSVDAGKSWTHMGLDETGRIAKVLVHPKNPDTVFVCAVGRTTGPQQERGVFRTTDGGQHWERVLFVDENTGCSGLAMDPNNPRTLFAGTWQVEMHTWAMFSGGPGSAVFVSHDGGSKWTRIEGHGLPKSPVGKIDVAVAQSDSNRVYALIQTKDQGSLWRSDDGGESWRVVNWQRGLIGRAGYYIRLAVSPTNENEILVADSAFWQSTDGGDTFREVDWSGDSHDIWIDPSNPDRFAITDDGGVIITTQHGRSFMRPLLPIGQTYHVAVDNQVPYYVYSNMQDDGTMRGPVTQPEVLPGGYSTGAPWEHHLGGCESGFTIPDLTDPNIVWATCYGNKVTRYDARSKLARSVAPSKITLDSPPNDAKYRCHWTAPIAVDPFDHNSVYYGCQVIFKTTNGGQSWNVISPDLSTNDPSRIVSSGGIVGDNLGQFYGEVVFAIAPSEVRQGLIWAGTNDGQVWLTTDGGAHWTNLTKRIVGLPAWGTVTRIEPSHFDAGTAYIAVDFHLMDNRDPFIYRTTDFGQTWKKISDGLPAKHPLAYVRTVAESPNRKELLFAGTGHGFYYSLDEGAHWTELQTGLPRAPVTWIATQKAFHDVVVSTYGRGLYVLDDVTPLEQMSPGKAEAPVRLFTPRPTYRFTDGGQAFINFSLAAAPKEKVKLDILDAQGAVLRTLQPVVQPGLNRVRWDLRYEGPRLVALRATPPENAHLFDEPRFRGKDTRPVTHWGLEDAGGGPTVVPGTYSVRLTVEGRSFTEPLEILKDPKIPGSDADLAASLKLQLRIREAISESADMINEIEILRRELEEVQRGLRARKGQDEAATLVATMTEKLIAVEDRLIEPAARLSDDKYFVQAYRVYMNLLWLNGEVGPGAGDVAGGANFHPTDTSVAVLDTIEKELGAARTAYRELIDKDVPAYRRAMADRK